MTYNKTNWVNEETLITAEAMNNIENGIEAATNKLNEKADAKHSHDISEVSGTEKLAEKTFVSEAISNIVAAAPQQLDTLKELSDAINGDANFATTINAKLEQKVDKVSGKGLSTNDYTTEEKNKLAAIEAGANKTVLNNTVTSTSTTQAATANAVKTAYDKANHSHNYLPLSGGTLTGNLYLKVGGSSTNVGDLLNTLKSSGGNSVYEMPFQDGFYSVDVSTFETSDSVTVRKSGNVVMIEFTTLMNDGSGREVGYLPAGYRPAKKLMYCDGFENRINICPDGTIECNNRNSMGWIAPITFIAAQ